VASIHFGLPATGGRVSFGNAVFCGYNDGSAGVSSFGKIVDSGWMN